MEKTKRNYGIDLLRILCIFGVVVLHILGHGKVLETTQNPFSFAASWLLEIAFYPAVNCFVLISGFVGYRNERYYPKLNNLLYLFVTVLFYSVVICLVLKFFFGPNISSQNVFDAFFPVTKRQYWFFTSYFALFLISPALNLFVHKAKGKMLFIFVIAFLFVSAFSLEKDPFVLSQGYSFIWFALVYVLGAIIKKYNIINKVSLLQSLALIFISTFITWFTKVLIHFYNIPILNKEDLLVSYCSPTVVAAAFGLICLFSKIEISKCQKLISFFASSAFSVYLIHDNFHFRTNLMAGSFAFINDYNTLLLPVFVLLSALIIFVACTLIDKVRALLFDICRIKKLCEKLERVIKGIISFVYRKVRYI